MAEKDFIPSEKSGQVGDGSKKKGMIPGNMGTHRFRQGITPRPPGEKSAVAVILGSFFIPACARHSYFRVLCQQQIGLAFCFLGL
jgi:hypothetical protein